MLVKRRNLDILCGGDDDDVFLGALEKLPG